MNGIAGEKKNGLLILRKCGGLDLRELGGRAEGRKRNEEGER